MKKNLDTIRCECGKVKYTIKGMPLFRAYCHCSICQKYNQKPYGDIVLFQAKDIETSTDAKVDYESYKFPWILHRGTCRACSKPTIEHLKVFPIPKIIIVPAHNISEETYLVKPSIHIFYDTRVEDIKDGLPKYSGYLKSQFAFSKKILTSLI
ncbi:MAG: GFA family protein [Spirochaetota bacterium]